MTTGTGPHSVHPSLSWARTTPLFEGLSDADLSLLLSLTRMESHPDGYPLFQEGEAAGEFYLVMDGHVELFTTGMGRRSVLEVAHANAVLGEAAMFLGAHPHSARVVGFARLASMPARPFLDILEERFDLAARMLSSMSRRLRGLVTQIAGLKLQTTAQRVGAFLLGLTPKTEGCAQVRFPYDKRLAAEHLGMSAESLSRALARLEAFGVESRAENLVAIDDIGILRAFCVEEDPPP